ncbi:MAG: phage holin [Oribacterium sp.]|nr:phage holin [Oribacterium sp.]
MKINWKIRLRNKTWLLTAIGAIVSLVYQLLNAFGITPDIGQEQVMNWVTSLLSMLAMIGVIIDPTTPGSSDSDRAMNYGAPVSADQKQKDEAAVIEAGEKATEDAKEAANLSESPTTSAQDSRKEQEPETKAEEKPTTPTRTTPYKGIDVSAFQKAVDWAKVKEAGVEFAFIRAGGRYGMSGKFYGDSQFDANMKGANTNGIHAGVYFFSQAITEAEAVEEADYTINKAKSYKVDCPVVIDTESLSESRGNAMTKAQRTAVMKAFCERVKALGYVPMIYASTSWLNNQLDMSELPYKVWCAQYYSHCEYKGSYDAWQYSSSGSVAGVNGNCDMDYGYIAWWDEKNQPKITPAPAPATPKAESKPATPAFITIAQQQVFLRTYFYYYRGPIDGIKGDGTIAATKAFQSAQGLTADGIWGINTDTKARSCARALQAKVGATQDGIIGTQTINALKAYQRSHNLEADGIMGPATYSVLFLGKPAPTSAPSSGLPAGYISPHFRKVEFRCGCGGRYCNGYNGRNVDPRLLTILEKIRAYYGKPITITSGIRCQTYNDSLRGSIKNSVHRLGGAADIYIPGVTTTAAGRAQVKNLAYQYGAAYCYYGTANMGNAIHINV